MPTLRAVGNGFSLDERPFDMWGLRAASGTMHQAQTDHLIDHLGEYRSQGVNSVTVYYQGCSRGYYDPFSPDGRTLDPGHADRMKLIAAACAARGMILIAGIFYQNAPLGLADRYDLCGKGTADDPGIRWYFEHVANVRSPQ